MTSVAEIGRLAKAHDRIIERLDASHGARLATILDQLEFRVVEIANEIPIDRRFKEGRLTRAELAIRQRPMIEAAIRTTFLGWAHQTINGYDEAASSVVKMMKHSISGFIENDADIINNLKRISFAGYEDIANRFLDTLSNGLYQNAIAGRSQVEAVKDMQQAINGVFIKSDDAEISRLVKFVKDNADDPKKSKLVALGIEKLHTFYGADRAGNNLRRYAYQQVHDGLMQFSASFTAKKARDAGLKHYQYYGSIVTDSRPWCVRHAGMTMTIEEIREKWANNSWKGKAPGEPLIVRGGYNCRHHFVPVEPEWVEEREAA